MQRIKGICTAIITPFDKNGDIDEEALRGHVDFLIESGVHNLYPCGTLGEGMSMNVDERKRVAQIIFDQAKGRVKVFVHVGALRPQDAFELAQHAEKIGAAGVGSVTPFYYGLTQKEMYEYFKDLANSVSDDFSVYAYNLPGNTTNDILPETVLELSKTKNIVGIKNTMFDVSRISRLKNTLPEGFQVIIGEDIISLPAFALGADGSVSGFSNMFPETFVKMYNHIQKNEISEAALLQNKINMYCQNWPCFKVSFLKDTLHMRGFKRSYCRAPISKEASKEEYEYLLGIGRKAFKEEGFFG